MKTTLSIFIILTLITGCQTKDLLPTHNTPSFDKGNQFEGGLNVGLAGAHMNIAYTPIKHLAIQSNASFFYKKRNSVPYYNNYAEGAVGFYYPWARYCIGLNSGYGIGATKWKYDGIFGVSAYTMWKAHFDYENLFFHGYFCTKFNERNFAHGFSLRTNFFTNTYHSASAYGYGINTNELPSKGRANEITYFMKKKVSEHIYFHLNAGLMGSRNPDRKGAYYARFGFLFHW